MNGMHAPNSKNSIALIPVNPAIESYLRDLLTQTGHPVLTEMEVVAQQKNFPIIGPLVGVCIETLARAVNAKRIFEFGSGYSYSAYWFAKAVGPEGCVYCSDSDPHNQEQAQAFLGRAGFWDRIDFKTGMAQDIFARTEGVFDVCYNDVDKGDYPDIWNMAKGRICPGGLYIADNVLWHGRVAVADYVDIAPGWTEAIIEHNRLIFNDPEFDAFINPTRDGVVVARRKTE